MKTKLCGLSLATGLVLAMPQFSAPAQESAGVPPVPATNAVPAAVGTNAPGAVTVSTNFPVPPEPGTERPKVPDPEAAQAKPLPEGMMVSPSLNEVIRMANAGVDPRVMMSFVTNSAGTFNLGSDQIIYLKDLGLPSDVIASMIEHDLAINTGQFKVTASTVPVRPQAAGAATTGTATPSVSNAALQPSVWQPAPTADPNAAASTGASSGPYAPTYATGTGNAGPPPPAEGTQAVPQEAAAGTVVNNNYFYQTLSPYGNWVTIDGYGTVWQPTVTVIDTSWRPYMNGGRWIYTDCGWYWNSDYAWGSTFHYGRWFYAPTHGWCWWPNTVWGPAWVTWRTAPAYCGWAPLPPYCGWSTGVGLTWYGSSVSVSFGFNYGCGYYNWVPWSGFCSYAPYRHAVPPRHAPDIYRHSTVVNNMGHGDHHQMVNHGVDVNHVARAGGQPVPRGTIRDVDTPGDHPTGERVRRAGNQYVIERPHRTREAGSPSTPGAGQRIAPPGVGDRENPRRDVAVASTGPTAPGGSTQPARGDRATVGTARPSVGRALPAPQAGSGQTVDTRNLNPRSNGTTPRGYGRAEADPAIKPISPPTAGMATTTYPSSRSSGLTPSSREPAPQRSIVAPTPPGAVARTPITAPSPSATPSMGPRPSAPSAPTYSPPIAPVQRPTYTGPTVASRAPAPTYSAPSISPSYAPAPPTRSAAPMPAPSYSAPSAPAMRAPAAAPSAPAPSMRSSPTPAPSSGSSGGSGGGYASRGGRGGAER